MTGVHDVSTYKLYMVQDNDLLFSKTQLKVALSFPNNKFTKRYIFRNKHPEL